MSQQHTPFFTLLEDLQADGCPLCRAGGRAVRRFIEGLLYESVTDPDTRHLLVQAHGLCSTHSAILEGEHDSLGSAIVYRSILTHLEEELAAVSQEDEGRLLEKLRGMWSRGEFDSNALGRHVHCPACVQRDQAVRRMLSTFAANYDDEALQAALAQSPGVCLPHLRQALAELQGPALGLLLARQRDAWQALHRELDELIRKHDHRARGEKMGDEKDAWQRAIHITVGEPGLF